MCLLIRKKSRYHPIGKTPCCYMHFIIMVYDDYDDYDDRVDELIHDG